jgi:ribonuclease P/MRP protein subunit RPP1
MYDLNIKLKSTREKDLKITVKRLFELGWDCVAWTTLANGKVTGTQIKPIKGVLMESIQRRDALQLRSLVTGSTASADIRQLSRITVTIDDMIDAQTLTVGNAVLNSFDIVAVRPGNMKVFAHLCKVAEIDIITLDFTHRLPFALNKKLLDEAVERGIFFEIVYSPVIGTVAGARREVFSNTRLFIQYLRGRNLILSSGADTLGQLRGPMDVCNIGK